jgi:hypothetical protein
VTILYLLESVRPDAPSRVSLNDVPIRIWPDASGARTTDPVNQWIRPGKNQLSVRLESMPQAQAQGSSGRLRAVLRQRLQGAGGGSSADEIARLEIPPDKPAGAIAWPLTATVEFQPAAPPPSRIWSEIEPLGPVDSVRGEALQLLTAVHSALNARNLEQLSALLRTKALEMAACYGFPVDQALARQREFFSGLMEGGSWAMEALAPAAIELHLVADKRMLWVTRNGRAPALRSSRTAGGAVLELPVYLARIRGVLTVVR